MCGDGEVRASVGHIEMRIRLRAGNLWRAQVTCPFMFLLFLKLYSSEPTKPQDYGGLAVGHKSSRVPGRG